MRRGRLRIGARTLRPKDFTGASILCLRSLRTQILHGPVQIMRVDISAFLNSTSSLRDLMTVPTACNRFRWVHNRILHQFGCRYRPTRRVIAGAHSVTGLSILYHVPALLFLVCLMAIGTPALAVPCLGWCRSTATIAGSIFRRYALAASLPMRDGQLGTPKRVNWSDGADPHRLKLETSWQAGMRV